MTKYNSKKTVVDGITFSSKKEAHRYTQLKKLEDNRYISDLRLQVKYELAPSVIIGGRKRPPIRYFADFVYIHGGKEVVEDCKGMRTAVYNIKRHLMKSVHGIDIVES